MKRHRITTLLSLAVLLVCTICLAAPPGLDDPLIKGVSPVEGQAGRQVLITGVNFGSAPELRFDGQLAQIDAHREDLGRLIATVPSGTSLGSITVVVTNTGTSETSNDAAFTVLAGSYAATCTISGSVTDPASSPMQGALVLGIDPVRGTLAALDTTDATGAYSLALDPAGDYNVLVVPPAGSTSYEGRTSATCTGVLDYQLASGHRLSGRVLSATSAPIANARIVASDDADFDEATLSDASGLFSLRVPAADYEVLVEGPVGGRHVSTLLEPVTVGSDTELGDIVLADGVLVEGAVDFQDEADATAAMNTFIAEYDFDGTLAGATSSIADGSFYLPSPSGGSYSLRASGDRRDVEDLVVFSIAVAGDMTLDIPLRLYSRAGQLPWRPVLVRTPALDLEIGQRIVFDAFKLRGSSISMHFPDGLGGLVEGVDTLAEVDRGGVVTTVPSLASSGEVILRVDGIDSPGYPLAIASSVFDPGPFTSSGIVDDSAAPVEDVFVAIFGVDCSEEFLVDYDLTAADGSYSVEHGAGDHYLGFLPPVESGLAKAFEYLPGLTGGETVNVSLATGHAVTAHCIDSGAGVVGGASPVSDCLVSVDGETLDHEDDALADDGGDLQLNLPTGTYEFEVVPPFGSRFLEDDASQQTITEDTNFGDVELDSGYLIEGRIVDPAGEGLAGVAISAVPRSGWSTVSETYSVGQGGRFVLAVPPGSYDLYFEVHRDLDYFVAPVYGLEISSDLLVYPPIEAVEVGFIRGVLTDTATDPVGGVPVKAWHDTYGVVDELRSCADGTYSLRAPTGDFTIQALPTDEDLCLTNEFYDNHYLGCGADPVSVTAPAPVNGIDFVLEPAGSVSGLLTDDAGSATAGATVCAIAGNSLPFCLEVCVLSTDDGSFSIAGVRTGADYKIQAFGLGFPTKCWDDHVNCLSYDPVSVGTCVDTPGINFLMSGAPGPVPDGHQTPGTMMTATYDDSSDTLTVNWQPTCNADNHATFFGTLGDFSQYDSAECVMGVTGSHPMPAPPGNVFFLVVGVNEEREGSYGVDSSLNERPSGGVIWCGYEQDLSASCIP